MSNVQYEITFETAKFKNVVQNEIPLRLTFAINESLNYLRGVLQANTPIYQGLLSGSYLTTLTGEKLNLEGHVGTNILYGKYVELGRGPGKFPPVELIKQWTATKLGDEKLSFLVARKIATQGTTGYYMFKHTVQEAYMAVQLIFDKWFKA